MNHFYRNVPQLGNVAVSRHAQARCAQDGISEKTFSDVLSSGEMVHDGQDVVWRCGQGIRIVILLRPTPNTGAKLVKTVYREKPQLKLR